jgi:hypothetical protein
MLESEREVALEAKLVISKQEVAFIGFNPAMFRLESRTEAS